MYDRQCGQEFALLEARLDRYFVNMSMECPYQLPYIATFYQALFGPITEHVMELFLAAAAGGGG